MECPLNEIAVCGSGMAALLNTPQHCTAGARTFRRPEACQITSASGDIAEIPAQPACDAATHRECIRRSTIPASLAPAQEHRGCDSGGTARRKRLPTPESLTRAGYWGDAPAQTVRLRVQLPHCSTERWKDATERSLARGTAGTASRARSRRREKHRARRACETLARISPPPLRLR